MRNDGSARHHETGSDGGGPDGRRQPDGTVDDTRRARLSHLLTQRQPRVIEERFDTPAAAGDRLAQLGRAGHLVGPARVHAIPSMMVIEDALPARTLRAITWGATAGAVLGALLGAWADDLYLFTGSWGGLLSGGPAGLAIMLALLLGALGAALGGLSSLGARDPDASSMSRAHLRATVAPDQARGHEAGIHTEQ